MTLKATNKGVEISWNEVSEAKVYRIYRKEVTGIYEQIAKITNGVTQYTDTAAKEGTGYYYAVRAYNDSLSSTYKEEYIEYEKESNDNKNE